MAPLQDTKNANLPVTLVVVEYVTESVFFLPNPPFHLCSFNS